MAGITCAEFRQPFHLFTLGFIKSHSAKLPELPLINKNKALSKHLLTTPHVNANTCQLSNISMQDDKNKTDLKVCFKPLSVE